MLLGRTGGSGHDQQAAALVAELPWQRSRFWPTPQAHSLLSSCISVRSSNAPTLLLQADFSSACAACWRALSLGSSPVLPATVLFEVAASASQLLHEDAASTSAVVVGATVAPPAMLAPGQSLLLSCSVSLLNGTAQVQLAQLDSTPLLSWSYAFSPLRQPAGSKSQSVATSMARLVPLQPHEAAVYATAGLAAPKHASSGSTLPFTLCEAAASLAAGAGLAGGQATVRSCAAFMPRLALGRHLLASHQQQVVIAATRGSRAAGQQLITSCGSSGVCTGELYGLEFSGSALRQSSSSSYAMEWQRIPTDQVDPRRVLLLDHRLLLLVLAIFLMCDMLLTLGAQPSMIAGAPSGSCLARMTRPWPRCAPELPLMACTP